MRRNSLNEPTHRYKVVEVKAWRLPDQEQTTEYPNWVIQAAMEHRLGKTDVVPPGFWIVEKPDRSIGVYSPEAFEAEFESNKRPTLHDHERNSGGNLS